MLYNAVLLSHFLCFAGYLYSLVEARPVPGAPHRDKKGLLFGIGLLLSGVGIMALQHFYFNHLRVIPMMVIFVVIVVINLSYGDKPYTKPIYYTLLTLALLAACLGVARF